MERSDAERRLASSMGAHLSWARTRDRTARTAPAREGLRAKYAREIDPDGTMPAAERERAVDSRMRVHMQQMALRSVAARRGAKKRAA